MINKLCFRSLKITKCKILFCVLTTVCILTLYKSILPFTSLSERKNLFKNLSKADTSSSLKLLESKKPFTILYWTDWYGGDAAKIFNKPECQNEFVITSNKSKYACADAIVFQYVDLLSGKNIELPKTRKPNVPWILSFQEAPINHRLLDTKIYNGLFNFTATFRTDSEIYAVFNETLLKYSTPDKKWEYGTDFSRKFMQTKTKLAAWVVSNCFIQPSNRNELVRALHQHGIQIDIFGQCGNNSCGETSNCFKNLGMKYKFYLALENSLCVDYVTEKIIHGLHNGMVPIVWALGNLDNFAPPGSYIDAMEFSSVSELAKRILFLDKNDEEYFKYFSWRKMYNLSSINDPSYICYGWRKMKQVTEQFIVENRTSVYENLESWFLFFKNEKSNKFCLNCLTEVDVSVQNLKQNKHTVYNGGKNRCI